jgi:hypothetical protein
MPRWRVAVASDRQPSGLHSVPSGQQSKAAPGGQHVGKAAGQQTEKALEQQVNDAAIESQQSGKSAEQQKAAEWGGQQTGKGPPQQLAVACWQGVKPGPQAHVPELFPPPWWPCLPGVTEPAGRRWDCAVGWQIAPSLVPPQQSSAVAQPASGISAVSCDHLTRASMLRQSGPPGIQPDPTCAAGSPVAVTGGGMDAFRGGARGSSWARMLSRRTIIVAGGGLVAARKSGAGVPAASPSSPPAPGTAAAATPVPLGSEEIVFTLNDGTTTHGLFAYPSGGAPPFPGVLLLQSSGAIDRDATVVEPDGTLRRPFVQLADELTKRGMAVFRYDKRGVCPPSHVCDPIRYLNLTKPVLIDDALAAYGRMTANPLIDPKRTAVLGHDEGAWLAPYLPYRFPQIRALVVIGTGLGPMHVLTFSLVTLPLLGLGFYDANADGMLSANEVPITDAAAMARFQERVRGPGQIFLLRYEGEPQRLRPAGLNRLLDTNGDGRLDILTEVRPVYEALLANLASPFSVIDRYVDPSISFVRRSVAHAGDGREPVRLLPGGADGPESPRPPRHAGAAGHPDRQRGER